MIAAEPDCFSGQKEAHVKGWLISILLHGTVAFAALLLVKQTHLAPQDEPFKWDVAMMSPTQPVQPTASSRNQAPASLVQSTTSGPSSHTQQSASAETLPSPQPLAQQTTPSEDEQPASPVMTLPNPPQPTTPSQSAAHTTQPAEPIRHEVSEPIVTEASSIVNQSAAQTTFSEESSIQTTAVSTPSAILQQIEQSVQAPDPAPAQMATASSMPLNVQAKHDYGWLTETISRRVEELRHYPASARLDTAEGKVVVKFVIHEDGSIGEAEVFQSSGHPDLDKAALETLRQATPFHLPRPLGKPRMTLKIPIKYFLD
ncbi:MAG: TonB family protein [Nitrospiraceae bacterium]